MKWSTVSLMSAAIYVAPHMNAWLSVACGACMLALGIYCFLRGD